jgi:orotate phosphoribosyltransferase
MIDIENKLTPLQEETLLLMHNATRESIIRRRIIRPTGEPYFVSVSRPCRVFEYAKDDCEFVGNKHKDDPMSALLSCYINFRNLEPKFPELFRLVVNNIIEAAKGVEADFCTGLPNAGEPLANLFEEITGLEYRQVFQKITKNGQDKIVAHPNAIKGNGARLLKIDDVITMAGSIQEAHLAEIELGYNNAGTAVCVDREEGGRQILETKNHRLYAGIMITDAHRFYFERGFIDENRLNACLKSSQDSITTVLSKIQ